MNRIVTIKMAAYFFCVVGSASLCAMELEVRKSKNYSVIKKALLCDEIMKTHGVPQEVAAIVKRNNYLVRMDTIYKKFDPFFNFNASNYDVLCKGRMKSFKGNGLSYPYNHNRAQEYAHVNCRKFDVVTPDTLFFFTTNQDEILVSLVSRPGCFIHHKGDCRIELTKEEREKYLMLPDQFRHILSQYPRSYVSKK